MAHLPDSELGLRLRQARIAAGLTLQQLSDKVGDVSIGTLSKVETGQTLLTEERLLSLAKALNLSSVEALPELPEAEIEQQRVSLRNLTTYEMRQSTKLLRSFFRLPIDVRLMVLTIVKALAVSYRRRRFLGEHEGDQSGKTTERH